MQISSLSCAVLQRATIRRDLRIWPIAAFALLASAALTVLSGCSTGPMEVKSTHYYAVANGDRTNFYRLKVSAETRLGVSAYREGWFPARAVDNLFGKVEEGSSGAELQAKTDIRDAYNAAVVATTEQYLDLAKDLTKANDDPQLLRAFDARRRVLQFPRDNEPLFPGSYEIEYSPDRGVAITHSDEKLVMVLSSDPDQVISGITAFAESEKTILSINNLAKLVGQDKRNDVVAAGARDGVQKQSMSVLSNALQESIDRLAAIQATDTNRRLMIQTEIDGLLNLVASLRE